MKIAVVGAGPVGTAFAARLVVAGHDVTLVARSARLDALTKDGGAVRVTKSFNGGAPVRVGVAPALDPSTA